ncbi:MAG: CoA ligase [Bacteroidetes bacterium HGW-Bacteroidetes-16]|jgi:acetyltransferase|nr:MAG: CoA ligase [Bacteroidetes bacterium HGW-Bacteroidetes-16]
MVNRQLTHPQSIVVIGGSNDIQKPGGKILKNLIDGKFLGRLMVLNPKEDQVQGIRSYKTPEELPEVDLAIIAIAAKYTPELVEFLTENKNTKAFIILSAGYSEESHEGKLLEDRVVAAINKVDGALIGPNCVGILTPQHQSIFTMPIPRLSPKGCDFISGSGATACFIMEAGIPNGLQFANVYSVGNSAQLGVEDILQHMDEHFNAETDSHVKLLYLENIDKPELLLKHAASLIKKGCRIAAIKAGSSDAGSRAASSHTGALASPDDAVDALFRKAGIVRCFGREDLVSVASVFMYPELKGRNIAIITHAGGPAVMLTDSLSHGGLEVPAITGSKADKLKNQLFPGSSVNNPIDFLATGTAEQLGIIIDAVEQDFSHIDAMIVIFGTPGLAPIYNVYSLLLDKMKTSLKPIYPVLPSVLTAASEVKAFVDGGGVFFPDEVILANALTRAYYAPKPVASQPNNYHVDKATIRKVILQAENGYLTPEDVQQLLDAAGISRAIEKVICTPEDLMVAVEEVGFPLVMKVVGPVHKSDVGGVTLNIQSLEKAMVEMDRMMKIEEATGVLLQPMLIGTELFAGVKKQDKFGHMILFGLGGIFIEVLKDVQSLLAPITESEVMDSMKKLRAYKLIQGVRGKAGVNAELFAQAVAKLSALVEAAPEIVELDLNPLLGTPTGVVAVDARIRIEK